ncbi:envelope-like protein, partial [Trifolium medium]|nr:envelope-like protein [Trifolium medium]
LTLHYKLFGEHHVPDIVGTSNKSAPAPMSRKHMITALKDTCRVLDEKKMKFELMIQALELEEAAVVGENAGSEEEEDNADDAQEEYTAGSDDV